MYIATAAYLDNRHEDSIKAIFDEVKNFDNSHIVCFVIKHRYYGYIACFVIKHRYYGYIVCFVIKHRYYGYIACFVIKHRYYDYIVFEMCFSRESVLVCG